MSSFEGKVITITGAASGIGHTTAKICAARGASLALADLNLDVLNSHIAELKSQFPKLEVIGTGLNVTDSKAVDDWVASTISHFGRIDGAANIAGVDSSPGQPSYLQIVDMSDEHFKFVNDVNMNGVFYCIRAQLRVMKSGGSIVNASSTAGLRGGAGLAAYCASKHAVVGLTKTAAKEAGKSGIRINAVCPGPIDTPMLRRIAAGDEQKWEWMKNLSAMGRLGTIEEIAKSFSFLLSDDASWISGETVTVDGCSM